MKGKLVSVLVMVFVLMWTSCSSEEEVLNEHEGPVEITFMHIHGGSSGEVVKQAAERFNSMQDNIIVSPMYVEGSYEGVLEKLQALAAVDQLPDLTQSGFQYTNYMVENMPIIPAYEFIESENMDVSDFYPTMLNLARYTDGKIYGLPIAVSNPVLYYNLDFFEEAGLSEVDVPETFHELREISKRLTGNGKHGVYFDFSITGNWLFQAMVESFGGQMVADDQKSVAFDSRAGMEVMKYWNDLVNIDKSMPFLERTQAIQSFNQGNIAMFITTTAALRSFQNNSNFEVGTAKFPTWENYRRQIPGGGNNGFVLESTPEKEQAAWEFLKYLSSPEGTTQIASGMGYMAVRQSAVSDPDLMGTYLREENPPAYTTYTQIPDMTQWNNFPGRGGTRIFKIVQDNIQAVFSRQKTPEQGITEAARDANALIR
ncbi:MAG: ABC transporter substrate-binding protein [Spirochaeta sp.]